MKKVAPWNDPTIRWVCENHPDKEQEHRIWFFWKCGGAGMPDPKQRPREWCQRCKKQKENVDFRTYMVPMVDTRPIQSKLKICDDCHLKQVKVNEIIINQHNERIRHEGTEGQQTNVSAKG